MSIGYGWDSQEFRAGVPLKIGAMQFIGGVLIDNTTRRQDARTAGFLEEARKRVRYKLTMRYKLTACWLSLLLLSSLAVMSETPGSTNYLARDLSMETVAKIKAGFSTSDQVEQLLGSPWRTTNYGDCNAVDYQEFWEYVGKDATGLFRLHIEFDEDHIVRIIARVPKTGPITVLAAAPKPERQQHRH